VKILSAHHRKPSQIEHVSIDRSATDIAGAEQHLPDARITYDTL
jgi:hypothetical protein